MFKGIKDLVDTRLSDHLILEGFEDGYHEYLKIKSENMLEIFNFLKNDPDTKLNLLEQILYIKKEFSLWKEATKPLLMYQVSSIKLPYRASIFIDLESFIIPSLKSIYPGANGWQKDLSHEHGIIFEEDSSLRVRRKFL